MGLSVWESVYVCENVDCRERQRVAKLLKHKLRKAERLSSCVFSPNFSQMDFKVSDKSVSRLRVLLSLN